MTFANIMDVLDTKTNTKTKTNTTCFKDPIDAIFLKISGFKDIKYDMDIDISDMKDMDMVDMDMVDMDMAVSYTHLTLPTTPYV